MVLEYDLLAKNYDELYYDEQKKKLHILCHALGSCHNKEILDVGCGTFFSQQFFPYAKMTGIDASKEMITLAQGNIFLGKAEALPCDNDSFDVIISVSAIHNFVDPEQALKEMKRVLKKRGRVGITLLKKVHREHELIQLITSSFSVRLVPCEKDWIFVSK